MSYLPHNASPSARHGQSSARSKATDEQGASVIATSAHKECVEATEEHKGGEEFMAEQDDHIAIIVHGVDWEEATAEKIA